MTHGPDRIPSVDITAPISTLCSRMWSARSLGNSPLHNAIQANIVIRLLRREWATAVGTNTVKIGPPFLSPILTAALGCNGGRGARCRWPSQGTGDECTGLVQTFLIHACLYAQAVQQVDNILRCHVARRAASKRTAPKPGN